MTANGDYRGPIPVVDCETQTSLQLSLFCSSGDAETGVVEIGRHRRVRALPRRAEVLGVVPPCCLRVLADYDARGDTVAVLKSDASHGEGRKSKSVGPGAMSWVDTPCRAHMLQVCLPGLSFWGLIEQMCVQQEHYSGFSGPRTLKPCHFRALFRADTAAVWTPYRACGYTWRRSTSIQVTSAHALDG